MTKKKMKKIFNDWEKLYATEAVDGMPWFQVPLDKDLAAALSDLELAKGKALDVGTGPGTQAIALARLGFKVTGTDLSGSAVEKAKERARGAGVSVRFVKDDILKTRITGSYDLIFDRGCLHVLPPGKRKDYAKTMKRLLKKNGYLFVKCFSYREEGDGGPYRFTAWELRSLFKGIFEVIDIRETRFEGTFDRRPHALFATLRSMGSTTQV